MPPANLLRSEDHDIVGPEAGGEFSGGEWLRDEGGAGAVVEAVDGEIAAVDGEDFAEALALGDAEDGGVGEIHGTVGVFAHEFANPGNVAGVEGKQKDRASVEHFPERILRLRQIR